MIEWFSGSSRSHWWHAVSSVTWPGHIMGINLFTVFFFSAFFFWVSFSWSSVTVLIIFHVSRSPFSVIVFFAGVFTIPSGSWVSWGDSFFSDRLWNTEWLSTVLALTCLTASLRSGVMSAGGVTILDEFIMALADFSLSWSSESEGVHGVRNHCENTENSNSEDNFVGSENSFFLDLLGDRDLISLRERGRSERHFMLVEMHGLLDVTH